MTFARLITIFWILILTTVPCFGQDNSEIKQINKELIYNFSYQELVELSKKQYPEGILKEKLDYILNNPIVDNSINTEEDLKLQEDPKIGKFIRIASWNINRGLNLSYIKLLFTDTNALLSDIKDHENVEKIKEQTQILKNLNILVLNEVDIGMPRTGYRNVVEELARALKFNYAYGVEFLEVDPVHLGLDDYKWSEERLLFPKETKIQIDKEKYKGLHGSAILSQFPIKNCRIIRLPQAYDWFNGEKNRISELETMRRHAAELVFREDMIREIRQGSRMALLADMDIPGLDTPITIVATHLENRSVPKGRRIQIISLLKQLYDIKNPVILAGDFNTTDSDGTPTGVIREVKKKLKDPEFLAKTAVSIVIPPAGAINSAMFVTNFARKRTDPTVKNIPIIAPNIERELFEKIEDANFADNCRFDFRVVRSKTANGRAGMLANSNERALKGFVPTYIFERPLYVGKYKLDWIFVKAYLNKPKDKKGPYKLAPHFGRSLFDLNYAFIEPLSDHVPITVDLPLDEPVKPAKGKSKH